jgi:hypothetical protein
MPRRMSCSLTISAVRSRQKTVTRRHIDTWRHLAEGERLTLIEKGMGLPKGARQVVIAEVEVVSVTDEIIGMVDADEVTREGFEGMTPLEFIYFWLAGHGYPTRVPVPDSPPRPNLGVPCRRIAWRYLP